MTIQAEERIELEAVQGGKRCPHLKEEQDSKRPEDARCWQSTESYKVERWERSLSRTAWGGELMFGDHRKAAGLRQSLHSEACIMILKSE